MTPTRGYICIAQNTPDVDYLQQAYALAMNLKLTQSQVNNLTVCVDAATKKLITSRHRQVFDHIIDIPWNDEAVDSDWKVQNKWKYYYMSPYAETVILDTDMLFPVDVSYWWDILCQRDVWATTKVRTFRGEVVNSDFYRQCFTQNNLPNVYTAFFYFKKSELAAEVFKMTELIFQNWQRMYFKYLPNGKPDYLSGDVAFALAIQILGVEHQCTRENIDAVPTFVHMKSHVQNFTEVSITETWCELIPTYYNSYADFKIGNFQQLLPFHYVHKEWLTDQMISQLEDHYGFG